MSDTWSAVDTYYAAHLLPADSILDAALANSDANGLPQIQVAPMQGKFLMILAQSMNAQSILEVGTLGGYSTIWLGRALPADGHLITLEISPKHAEVARENLKQAGLSEKCEIRVGSAHKSMPQLLAEGHPPFDLIFIDADKPSTYDYFQWALQLAHPGTVIIVDNAVRGGEVANLQTNDSAAQGIQRFVASVDQETRITATVLQTVGVKGYDGMVIARVK
jgi:predicted O-methyltransferase YrrM